MVLQDALFVLNQQPIYDTVSHDGLHKSGNQEEVKGIPLIIILTHLKKFYLQSIKP